MSRSAKLLRVALSVDAGRVESAIAVWELAGVHNSSVEYVLGEPTEEPWPGHDNRPTSDGQAEVVAYLSPERWAEIEASARASAAELLGVGQTFDVKRLPDRDWRTAWHEHFDLVRVPATPRHSRTSRHSRFPRHSRAGGNHAPKTIIVRPPHIPYDAKPDEVVIDLAPGLAFGTGQHQSTRLCLGLLAEYVQPDVSVLDVGTGSGILAVAAAKLGATSVTATDIDPLAVDAARDTARRNRVAIDVQRDSIPPESRFDLVVANLTADLLQYLAQDLAGALRPEGQLIASGLIASRQAEVVAAFGDCGLRLEADQSEDDWRALLFRCPT